MIAIGIAMLALAAVDDAGAKRCSAIANPADRLACFDALQTTAPEEPEAPPTREELARRAVDSMLARSLVDPTSALDYRVSDPLPCKSIEPMYGDPNHLCACYSVNSKNRMGGYSGAKLRAVSLIETTGMWLGVGVIEIRNPVGIQACGGANLTDRPASLIADQVKR